jgi:hypothetical protein
MIYRNALFTKPCKWPYFIASKTELVFLKFSLNIPKIGFVSGCSKCRKRDIKSPEEYHLRETGKTLKFQGILRLSSTWDNHYSVIEFSCNRSSGSLLCYFKLKGSTKVALIDGSGLQIAEDDRLIWPVIFILLTINKILLKFFRISTCKMSSGILQHWSSISYTEKDEKLKRDIDPITTGWMSRHSSQHGVEKPHYWMPAERTVQNWMV